MREFVGLAYVCSVESILFLLEFHLNEGLGHCFFGGVNINIMS